MMRSILQAAATPGQGVLRPMLGAALIVSALAFGLPSAQAQLFGTGGPAPSNPDVDGPPTIPYQTLCATDAENEELRRELESWKATASAYEQAKADQEAAYREQLAEQEKAGRAEDAFKNAKDRAQTARMYLSNGRAQGLTGEALANLKNDFEASVARVVATRKAAEEANRQAKRFEARWKERDVITDRTRALMRAAGFRYYDHEMTLRKRTQCAPKTSAVPRPAPSPTPVPVQQSRLPQPAPSPVPTGTVAQRWGGFNIGVYTTFTGSQVDETERFAALALQTNAFSDSSTRTGGGFTVGYNTVVQERYLLGIVFNVSVPDSEVRHPFPPTRFFLGSTQNLSVDILGRAGVLATPSLLLYGQGGVTVANNRLQIDFGGVPTDENRTSVAGALGGGIEVAIPWMASGAGMFGFPTVFVDYLHGFRSNTQLIRPAASPLFNYDFDRSTDQFKLGVRIKIQSGPPAREPGSRL